MKSQHLDDCFTRSFRTDKPKWVGALGFHAQAVAVSDLMSLAEGAR